MHKTAACLLIAFSALAQSLSSPLDLLLEKGAEEMSRGDLAAAEADFTAALSASQAQQDQAHEVYADYHLFMLSELRHNPDAAEKWLLNGLATCRKPGSRLTTISVLPYLHSFYARHGMWAQDAATLQSIVGFYSADQSANVVQLAVYSRLLGDALMKIHDYPSAETAFRSYLAFTHQHFPEGTESADQEQGLMEALEKQRKKDQIAELKAARQNRPASTLKSPHLLARVPPAVPEYALKANVTGHVILSVNITESGEVKDIKVIVPVGFGMERNFIEAVQRWTFKPGTDNGKPISIPTTIEFSMGGR